MIKVSSLSILEDFKEIIDETIAYVKQEALINDPKRREALEFETTALIFWLFQETDVFPKLIHKLILDEVHAQYYNLLREGGFDSVARQKVCDNLNLRYKAYIETLIKNENNLCICIEFVNFLSRQTSTELNDRKLKIPLYIIKKSESKFKEFKNIVK